MYPSSVPPTPAGPQADSLTGHVEYAARAMDSLRRIVHALRVATGASERALGLTAAQLFVLRQLAVRSDQSLNDLAMRTHTAPSSVSEVVSRLVRRGLVARRAASTDRRRAELTLTSAGRAMLQHAPESVQERLLAGFGRLADAEQRALAEALEAWLAASGLERVPPTLFFEASARDPAGPAGRQPSM